MAYKHHDHEGQEKYKIVDYVDVNDLLSFAKKEYNNLEEQIKEEQRVEQELKEFIKEIEKNSNHKIHFIGHEKRYGNHMVRFLFKDGGFLEVILDKPLAMNAHFVDEEQAKKFAEGFKKALEKQLPEHPIKKIIIDNINVKDGFSTEHLTFDKWTMMHKIAIHRTIVGSVFGILTFALMEFTKFIFEESAPNTLVVSITLALVIAFLHEPIAERVQQVYSRLIK